jgi:DNA polymerase V
LPIGPAAIAPRRRLRPVGAVRAELGFPSPAEDCAESALDLNDLILRNEPATFYYRASGQSMVALGILDGDVLAVDRSVSVEDGDLVLAVWEGNAPACKLLRLFADHIELHSGPEVKPIVFAEDESVEVFAIVGVIRPIGLRRHSRDRPRRR